jgi:hypothetical protein
MTAMRRLAAIAVLACGVAAVYQWCVLPWQCNIGGKRLKARTAIAYRNNNIVLARNNAGEIRQCIEMNAANADTWMILAANEHVLQRHEAAVDAYQHAGSYGTRPEIDLNLGLELIETGRRDEGIAAIVRAVRRNPLYMADLDNVSLKREVNRSIAASIPPATNLLRNAGFTIESIAGRRTTFSGQGDGGPSAAARWLVANSVPATTTTEILPSDRPGSQARILRIHTSGAGCGIIQVWGAKDVGPEKAMTSAWVRVRSGRIMISSGNAEYTTAGTESRSGSGWQHLESINATCPGNRTVIFSVGGGADFDIESPSVVRLDAACEMSQF